MVIEEGSLVSVPGFDLNSLLKLLPFSPPLDDNTGPDLIMDMIQGNKVKQSFSIDGKNQTVYITVDLDPALFLKDEQSRQSRMAKPERKPAAVKRKSGKNRGIN